LVDVPRFLDRHCNRDPNVFPLRDDVSRTHEPVVVWAMIALNAAVFLYQLSLGPNASRVFLYEHALVPLRYFSPGWAREVGLSPTDFSPFLTNTFMHGGWLHIILKYVDAVDIRASA
jgi:membrane associated rhomboid family serine protease